MNARSPLPGRRAASAAAIRTRLLDAAETLLSERQPGAITSRELARAAGVSDGVLYNHFEDKHDVLVAALMRRFTGLVTAWLEERTPVEGLAPAEALADLVRRAHALHLAALPMLANLVGDPPLFQRFLVEIHRPPLGGDAFRRPIVEHLAAEQARGRLGRFDSEAAADLIVGAVLLQGLIDVLAHRPADESARRLAAITATLLAGLRPAGAPDTLTTPSPGSTP